MQLVFLKAEQIKSQESTGKLRKMVKVGCFAIQNQTDGMPEINLINTASS